MTRLFAALVAVFLCLPAQAQNCVTVEQFDAVLADKPGRSIATVEVPAVDYDGLYIFSLDGVLHMVRTSGGCIIPGAMPLGAALAEADA